ncbi:MAG: XdhC/CoxI family protein [Sphingobacteriales bacterium]|nr:MAG: XdhC/CoxI family protein [Sphingobacteriales bacterium]
MDKNLRTALATVVSVEGSSYRRPGARMLITEAGILTGAISGGCLEGDALKKALSAIHQQENKLVTYDTTDEDDAKFGVQLGCNGVVHILFEPIKEDAETSPITILKALQQQREDAVISSLFSLTSKTQLGTSMLYRNGSRLGNTPSEIENELVTDSAAALFTKTSAFKNYPFQGEQIDGFIEYITPPISLIIVGAGNDAQPLATFADQLGWDVTVADGRPTHAAPHRFPTARQVLVSKSDLLLKQVSIDEHTAFVLMTHNYNYDLDLLGQLLKTDAPYIGVLGPKKKLHRMLAELNAPDEERIYGPVGLDIGAETAAEIAISIIAEIKSVFSGATAGLLTKKAGPVHLHSSPQRQ